MNFYFQKLFVPYETLILPLNSPTGKNNCFYFYGENVNFIETYNFLNIKKQNFKHIFVPTVDRPRSFLTPEYYKILKDRQLIPVKGRLGEYSKLHPFNFFFDATKYLNAIDLKYNVKQFNTGIGPKLYREYINTISGIDKTVFDTTLLYAVNLDKPIPNKLFHRKIFVIFDMLQLHFAGKLETLPFEKVNLFIFNKDGGRYIKLYDVNAKNNNINRVKQLLLDLQQNTDGITDEDNQADHTIQLATNQSKMVNKNNELAIQSAMKNYTKADSNIDKEKDFENTENLITKSVIYNMVGNIDQAKQIAKSLDKKAPEQRKEIINKLSENLLVREPATNSSTNLIIKSADVPRALDYQSPAHILNKRFIDFKVNLKTDIEDAFKLLAEKDVPLKLKKVEIKEVHSGPSEIYKTIKDRYFIDLEDVDGNIHNVHIDIPHLTENGSFLVNGQNKILVNQLVRVPIFFPTIETARFESSYSVMKIHSKSLQNGAYLICFAGSYKFPILMWLALKFGLTDALNDYGVKYRIE